jgi:hypothetical protein
LTAVGREDDPQPAADPLKFEEAGVCFNRAHTTIRLGGEWPVVGSKMGSVTSGSRVAVVAGKMLGWRLP